MAVVEVKVDLESLRGLKAKLRDDPAGIRKQLAGAVNDTAKHAKSFVSREIRKHVPLKKKRLDRFIDRTYASPSKLNAEVTVSDDKALPLKLFGARPSKKGIRVRFDKQGQFATEAFTAQGQKIGLSSAFVVDKLGGNIFARRGPKRLPIAKLFGPSPLDVYEAAGGPQLAQADAEAFLKNRIDHRLKYALKD